MSVSTFASLLATDGKDHRQVSVIFTKSAANPIMAWEASTNLESRLGTMNLAESPSPALRAPSLPVGEREGVGGAVHGTRKQRGGGAAKGLRRSAPSSPTIRKRPKLVCSSRAYVASPGAFDASVQRYLGAPDPDPGHLETQTGCHVRPLLNETLRCAARTKAGAIRPPARAGAAPSRTAPALTSAASSSAPPATAVDRAARHQCRLASWARTPWSTRRDRCWRGAGAL